jgi:hypothetical protein
MRVAYQLACATLPVRRAKFSRKDFTLPQLFACLVVREMLQLSYRKAEAFFCDSPDWLTDIGLARPPDHNTLWRAFGLLCTTRRLNRVLDLQARLFRQAKRLQLRRQPLAADSTCFEQRHRSRHYERRCRRIGLTPGAKFGQNTAVSADHARARELRRMPKLALAGASACHLVLAVRVHLGGGSDAPDFKPLLRDSCRRAPVKTVVTDSGYDSEENHRHARHDRGVRSIIPPGVGRPTTKPPASYWRRHMHGRFGRSADRRLYGQRAQIETIHSMIKRNLNDQLRSRLKPRRRAEMFFRAVVHNIMLVGRLEAG